MMNIRCKFRGLCLRQVMRFQKGYVCQKVIVSLQVVVRFLQMPDRRRPRTVFHSGFSLIELIVVIAIIGIISVVAIPNYTALQSKAKLSALTASGSTIQTALESYSVSSGAYPTGSLDGGQLMSVLIQSGDLKSSPKNPYTGAPFSSLDSAGKIQYSYDSTSQTYTLKLFSESLSNPAVTLSN